MSRGVVVGLALAGMAACARTSVENVNVRTAALPRPQMIVVYDFVVSPSDVSLNSGIGSRLLHMVRETPVSEEELKLGREVSRIVADHLVKEINKAGIAAFPASATVPIAVPSLAIEGQFLSVDEGNRLRRMVIGFGAGASELRTLVQAYETTPEGRRLVEDFYTTVKSSIKPGIAPMVPGSSRRRGSGDERGGERERRRRNGGLAIRGERRQAHGRRDREDAQKILRRAGLDLALKRPLVIATRPCPTTWT